jgi:hypothetical protein
MNSFKKIFSFLVCLPLLICSLYAQIPSYQGRYTCEAMENFLLKQNYLPEKVELITNTSNTFPYSIAVNFAAKDSNNHDNLIICISMEQALHNQDIVKNILTDLRYRNFSSSVIFVYDLSRKLMRVRNYNGIENFLKTLESGKKNSALIIKLDANSTELISNSWNYSAPSWMISNGFDAFINNGLSDYLPVYYLNQLTGLVFNNESYFTDFSNQNIPAITFSFKSDDVQSEQISNTITSYIDLFELSENREDDYHSLLYRMGSKKVLLSEYSILKALIIIIILSLFFIFILSFVNSNLKNEAWKEIRKDWFTIPITLAITLFAFFIAKLIYNAVMKNNMSGTPFGLVLFQILLSSALVSIFYWVEVSVRKKDYGERSIDFLVLIVTFVNQFIFCLADISLFPLFMVVCICSTLSLILKKNWFHIILFIIMILIYLPYVILVYNSTDSQSLRFFISRSYTLIFTVSLILLPIYLMWFRILTAIRKNITRKRHFAIIISSTYLLVFLALFIPNYTKFNGNKTRITYPKTITENDDSGTKIDVNYSTKDVLGQAVTTIEIQTPFSAEAVILQLTGDMVIPVIYSDDEYTIDSTKTVSFKIPSRPPQKMKFVFGSINTKYKIHAEAFYKTADTNEYRSYVKEINTEDQ